MRQWEAEAEADVNDLLRVYAPEECGADGYPFAWHRETAVSDVGVRLPPNMLAHEDAALPCSPAIKHYVREQAGHRCLRCGHPYPPGITATCPQGEWTPCDEHCTHGGAVRSEAWLDGEQHDGNGGLAERWQVQIQAHWRILTVHHLNEDKADCRWFNLVALCQRCHLRMQRAVVMDRVYHYEHSTWFRPYAAGFYAFKYLGQDLSRKEVEARMEELLALEHRFTQESLL